MENASVKEMELDSAVEEHPLLNSLIVAHIFELLQKSNYITPKNVNNLRYVCKTWYSLSLPIFRPVATIRLGPDNLDSHIKPLFPITEFLNLFQNPDNDPHEFQNLPFKNYVISGLALSDYTFLRDVDNPQSFWNIIGPLVYQLTFENCIFPGSNAQLFKRILNEKLPNLQKLSLINKKTEPPAISRNDRASAAENERIHNLKYLEVSGEVPMDVRMLLINSFNLETLRVRNNNTNSNINIDILIAVWCSQYMFRFTLGGRPEHKLKTLDVMHSKFFDIYVPLDKLWPSQLPLEILTLDLKSYLGYNSRNYHPNIDVNIRNVLLTLLEFHTDTLKVLKVYRPPVFAESRDNPFKWVMPKLEELQIWGNLVRNFEFLRNLPNLKKLMINPVCYDKTEIMQKDYFPESSVEELRLFSSRYIPFKGNMLAGMSLNESEYIRLEFMEELHLDLEFLTDVMVQVLARWMPNLKKFKANLNSAEVFRAVCKWMPNLEELGILYGGQLNNESVTGISENGEGERNIYNVTRLSNLKRFHQQLPACNYVGDLSDHAVYEGFLKLESLEWISVPVSRGMSEEAESALKEHVKHAHFIRNYRDNPHVDDGFCCKRKQFLACMDGVTNNEELEN